MKNKKLLNTILLSFALVILVGLILEFCKVVGTTNASVSVAWIFYYVFNVIFILAIIFTTILGICSLFKDNYIAIKLNEFSVLVAFLMNFLTVLVFALQVGAQLSWGYAVISILTFAMAMFSQTCRLSAIFKTLKQDLCSLFGCKEKLNEPIIPELKKGEQKKEQLKVVEGEIVE